MSLISRLGALFHDRYDQCFPYESSAFLDYLGNSESIREIRYLYRSETGSRPYDSWTKSVQFPIGKTTMNVSIHEDNSGALVLAKTLPPQFTPQSKILRNQDNLVS